MAPTLSQVGGQCPLAQASDHHRFPESPCPPQWFGAPRSPAGELRAAEEMPTVPGSGRDLASSLPSLTSGVGGEAVGDQGASAFPFHIFPAFDQGRPPGRYCDGAWSGPHSPSCPFPDWLQPLGGHRDRVPGSRALSDSTHTERCERQLRPHLGATHNAPGHWPSRLSRTNDGNSGGPFGRLWLFAHWLEGRASWSRLRGRWHFPGPELLSR